MFLQAQSMKELMLVQSLPMDGQTMVGNLRMQSVMVGQLSSEQSIRQDSSAIPETWKFPNPYVLLTFFAGGDPQLALKIFEACPSAIAESELVAVLLTNVVDGTCRLC